MSSGSTSGSDADGDSSQSNETLIIILSSVLSFVGVALIVAAAYFCTKSRRRRPALFRRGVTPIGDDEIATWKMGRNEEKEAADRYTRRPTHTPNASTSTRKAPSVIQYHNGGRVSLEAAAAASPRSFLNHKYSMDLPRTPEAAVLAVAPNARSGLTDDTVPGDDPFVTIPKRQPSRLYKLPQSPSSPQRTRGSRSSSLKSYTEAWQGNVETPSSKPGSSSGPQSHSRIYSSSSIPPRLSFTDLDHDQTFTGLSPPPSRRTAEHAMIGQAFG
ncbi:hypothetical protein F5Y15DRAFT_281351 [Xylariaceae sp. FL0016]|nr:hypothetical protein F5Y15DRAFT_281351 [Xylariaceae sp. FL0016]